MKTKINTISKHLILIGFLISCSCKNSSNIKGFEAKQHPFSIRYNSQQWRVIQPVYNLKDKVLFSLIDDTDKASFVLKITKDTSQDNLSNSVYYEAVKQMVLDTHEFNSFYQERNTEINGQSFHQLNFLIFVDDQYMLHEVLLKRTGAITYIIQLSYPREETGIYIFSPPEKIKTLLNSIQLD
ncbi:hypothetical protein [Psychroserpens sp. SPM9]|uniref:hypothetical protein n=1 Tax=Psychroserpens sp. SPM9 TaxID=2975598 RepID=UPI0021A88472|nr:hypothetical protein [Psychroserpens sp. SPM9]MDG5491538.1 hypothetical protein [Psychroserpens sp. SPM9]